MRDCMKEATMKACGVIAEYNPFHNGHAYQLKKAKDRSGAEVMVVVMSGNFLQRGEPAMLNKWVRAQLALQHGADLVVELPIEYSVQPADFFSKGSVAILDLLKCDTLSFGSETGSGADFYEAARQYLEHEDTLDEQFKNHYQQQSTYAHTMGVIIKQIFPDFPIDLNQPNNMLGFSYAREVIKQNSGMDLLTIQRKGSQHSDKRIARHDQTASGTAIRQAALSQQPVWEDIAAVVPNETLHELKTNRLISWDDFFAYLKYTITVTPLEELADVYLMEKGLEYRLKKVVAHSFSMEEFLTKLKTKQLTWARLQRLCVYILLKQSKQSVLSKVNDVRGLRVLGFTSKGQQHLSQIKHESSVPFITNVNQKTSEQMDLTILAGNVYQLADQKSIKSQDYKRKPIKFIDIHPSY